MILGLRTISRFLPLNSLTEGGLVIGDLMECINWNKNMARIDAICLLDKNNLHDTKKISLLQPFTVFPLPLTRLGNSSLPDTLD